MNAVSPRLWLAAAAAAALLTACTNARPPWADGAIVTEAVTGDPRPQSLANMPDRILTAHNRERRALGLRPLAWDTSLSAAAAAYAPQLAAYGRLRHSPPGSRPGQGENLWMGTAGDYAIEEMVGGWAAEKALFRPGLFPDEVSASGAWSDVGHYTQMIWPATTRVGCTFHTSRGWDYLICRYAPAGNVVGTRIP